MMSSLAAAMPATSTGHDRGRIVGLLGAVATVALMSASTAVAAETFAQREACKPDVFRLCADYIPDRSSIVQCLVRSSDRLSPACRAVVDGKPK